MLGDGRGARARRRERELLRRVVRRRGNARFTAGWKVAMMWPEGSGRVTTRSDGNARFAAGWKGVPRPRGAYDSRSFAVAGPGTRVLDKVSTRL